MMSVEASAVVSSLLLLAYMHLDSTPFSTLPLVVLPRDGGFNPHYPSTVDYWFRKTGPVDQADQ